MTLSIVIPAHNEEQGMLLEKWLSRGDYPRRATGQADVIVSGPAKTPAAAR
jgi:hypothetical protein